ncbi:putative ribosomal RNA small subunit methyltransferase A [uncultured archaeon]|nr:putative ribosomal RNA small subunit methyltransferase A [uncultured archaeon]
MLEILRIKFTKEIEEKKLELIHEDFLEYKLPKKQLIIGAIPYHITTQIMLKLLETGFEKAVLVVQKEYAERILSEPGSKEYSRLTVLLKTQCIPEIIGFIPKEKFTPQPKVDSAILVLEPLKKKIKLNEIFVRSLFNHKKQTVKNALRHSRHEFKLDKVKMEEKINKIKKEFLDKKVYELSIPEISECEKQFLK